MGKAELTSSCAGSGIMQSFVCLNKATRDSAPRRLLPTQADRVFPTCTVQTANALSMGLVEDSVLAAIRMEVLVLQVVLLGVSERE